MNRKLVLYLFSLSLFAANLSAQTGANATWRVQKYDLNVTLPQDDRVRTINAAADLVVKNVSSASAGSLTLRIAPSAEVTAVKINGTSTDFSKSEEKVDTARSLQRIALRFAPVASGSTLTARVEYKLNVKDNTAVAAFSSTGAQMLPLSFWYPTPNSWYFTKGADAAPMRVTVTAPAGLSIVASGTETGGAYDQKLNSQPFFIAGSWETINANGISVYAPKGSGAESQKRAAELAALASEARTFVAGLLGNAPDAPVRIVATRRGAGFAESGTILVDEGIFRRSKVDSLTAMNIAEGVAKTWLGGSVSLTGDGNGVIGEGLSRYLATQFIETKYGKDVADIERLRQRNAYAAVSRRDAPMATVSPLDDFYYPEVANKGAMVWRILAKRVGQAEFFSSIRSKTGDSQLDLAELREAFSAQKELVDYFFDRVTDLNLIAGIPVPGNGETKVALRNTGGTDVTVDIVGTTATGERITAATSIRSTSLGEVVFKSPQKIVSAEVDVDKLYPQIEYSDDIAPRRTTDSDPLLAAKRYFDKQDFANAEKTARALLVGLPRFDDLRVLLGRSLLAQGKTAEAEKEFRAVLDEKLPSARNLAWANVGLAEVAAKTNQTDAVTRYIDAAILADAEYGASLAARALRSRLNISTAIDPAVKTYFADFDRAVSAKRKADIDAMVVAGEVSRFASGVAGSAEQWQTQLLQVDRIDQNTMLVETNMNIKLLNKNEESGTAVYRLVRSGSGWKMVAVEMFEVR